MSKRHILKTEQKALEIILDDRIYGTFAEIGAGQEVARHFFQVGAAAGTIAKTMSAYDKTYSDRIYGSESNSRYVCESRLYKMLDHEYDLIEERLMSERRDTNFFVFADTVSAINYSRTIKGNGWIGMRFQHFPGSGASDVVMHVKMLDKNNRQQQEAIGILGVNLVYACYHCRDDQEEFVQSLLDGLKSRLSIDMIRTSGVAFADYDDRLNCLYMVKNKLTEVAIFDSKKRSVHASEFLYRKDVMVVRGHFRPPTLVTEDAFHKSFEQFKNEKDADPEKGRLLAEITLENLLRFGPLDIQDFLDRTELLCALGHTILISDCSEHQRLINYLSDYKINRFGIVIGVHELASIIKSKYELNKDGQLLAAFGALFSRLITVYAYPALEREGDAIIHIEDLPVPEDIRFLYQHLLKSKQIIEVKEPDEDLFQIIPVVIYKQITGLSDGPWEAAMSKRLADVIKERKLFGHGAATDPFQYDKSDGRDAEYY